jgi:hypothetical protein
MKRTFLSTLIAACLTLGLAGAINVASGVLAPTTAHASVLGKVKGAGKSLGVAVKKAGGAVMNAGKTIGSKVGPLALAKTVGKGVVAGGKAVAGKVASVGGRAIAKAVSKAAVASGVAKRLKPKT